MDPDLDRLYWDDVFDDELAALLGLAPSLPTTLLPQDPLAFEAGVSTPDQRISPPSASGRPATQFQSARQQHTGATPDGTPPAPALPAGHAASHPSPCRTTLPCDGSLSDPSSHASTGGARRPAPTSLSQPTEHGNGTHSAPVALQAPSGRKLPSDQGSKRHKVDVKEERRRQQNKKDQQAYRQRTKVRHWPLYECALHISVRIHRSITEQATLDEHV